jgi:hypothetical protein
MKNFYALLLDEKFHKMTSEELRDYLANNFYKLSFVESNHWYITKNNHFWGEVITESFYDGLI